MQAAYFDNYANDYDRHFTWSLTGTGQRKSVHRYLFKMKDHNRSVLELNCGTGEDAVFLSGIFKEVLCTDVSPEMMLVCEKKTGSFMNCSRLRISIQQLGSEINRSFDIVFSDFGGLNCLNRNEMKSFAEDCMKLTRPDSDIILVIMGRKCLWERLYFSLKGDRGKARRRKRRDGVETCIHGSSFLTYYYSPSEIKKIFDDHFVAEKCRPVGLFIPPSYLENHIKNKPVYFSILKKMELLFGSAGWLADYADHYLIHLRRK